jgi:hypothetical protein
MSKQFVDPLVAENAKLKEIVESQQKMIHERMAMDPRYILRDDVFVNADEEDEGFCNECHCWEPICKFVEGDKLQQPCKGCYIEPEEVYEDNVDWCAECYNLNRHSQPPYALCYKCEEKEK